MTQQHPGASELQQHLKQVPQAVQKLDISQVKQVGEALTQSCDTALRDLKIDADKLPAAQRQSGQSDQLPRLPQEAQRSYTQLMAIATRPEEYVPRAQQPQIDSVFQRVDQTLQQRMTQAGIKGFGSPSHR
jgi:hypothetical protein